MDTYKSTAERYPSRGAGIGSGRCLRHGPPRGFRMAGAVLAFLLPGAVSFATGLDLDQRILLHADGSVETRYVYRIPESAVPLIASFETVLTQWRQGKDPTSRTPRLRRPRLLDRKRIERYFADAGCRVTRFNVASVEGTVEVRISVDAPDAVRAVNSGVFGNLQLVRTGTSADEWVLRSPLLAREHAGRKPLQSRVLQVLRPPVNLTLTVITPGRIVKTTADNRSEQGASWTFRIPPEGAGRARLPALPSISVRFRTPAGWPAPAE